LSRDQSARKISKLQETTPCRPQDAEHKSLTHFPAQEEITEQAIITAAATYSYLECMGLPSPPTNMYEHLLEPCWEPPPELWFSTPRFSPQLDLCLVVGLEKRFRSDRKCAPKVWSFSGPKIERTRWAPIMGAHLVLPKTRPEFDPSLWATNPTEFPNQGLYFSWEPP
jgi:hypothetical protein